MRSPASSRSNRRTPRACNARWRTPAWQRTAGGATSVSGLRRTSPTTSCARAWRVWARLRHKLWRSSKYRRVKLTPALQLAAGVVGSVQDMTKVERTVNLIAVVLPFVAFLAAIILLWNSYVGVSDLVAFGVMYLIAGFGVTVGFHRLLTHRAFQTYKPIEYGFAIAGSMSVQGPVIDWVADHRKHHAHADEEGDPHSPHVQFGEGWLGALKGLFHAHMGWLFSEHGQAERRKYAKDLVEDRGMRRINRRFHWWVLAGLAMGSLIGFVLGGFTLKAALTGLLWGGFVRIFLQHHVTWSINSVCHFFGRRRFEVEDESTNVFWLAIPSLGEAWHHNHHAFPRSARHGLKWYEIDLSAALIALLQKLGLAWNVTKIAPERQAQKLAGATREPVVSS